MTEIKLSYTLTRAGDLVAAGTLVTIDLSFPARIFESLVERYHADTISVRDSRGNLWSKTYERG